VIGLEFATDARRAVVGVLLRARIGGIEEQERPGRGIPAGIEELLPAVEKALDGHLGLQKCKSPLEAGYG
jgi:hypothetical protein